MKGAVAACLVASMVLAWPTVGFAEEPNVVELEGEQVIFIEAEELEKELGQVELRAEEAEEVPGVQGDALKALVSVGGVGRPVGGTGLSVWGAAPADTRVYIDDVPVPRLFHFGGTRSILPSSEISSFALIPGGAGARYGRGIGGAIVVQSAAPGTQPMSMSFRVDPLDVGGRVAARVGEQGAFSFASRSSVLSPIFKSIAPPSAEEVVAIPDYWDYQSRFSYQLEDGRDVQVLALLSGDDLERSIPSLIEDEKFSERSSASFGRLGVTLTNSNDEDSSRLTLWVGRDSEQTRLDYGDVLAQDRMSKNSLGLLLVRKRRLHSYLELRFGIDSELSQSHWFRDGAITLPAREGDVGVFGQAPGDRINEDDWRVSQASVGLFASARLSWGKALQFEPGLRVEPSVITGNRVLPVRPSEPEVGYSELQWSVSPRARVSYQVSKSAQLYLAAGRYSQAPNSGDLSPVFGSPVLTQARAWQALLGSKLQVLPWLELGVQGFTSAQRDLAVRAQSPTPAIANLLEARGQGRIWGAELSASADPVDTIRASLSYTFMNAARLEPGGEWRPFDEHVQHTLRSMLQWAPGHGFSLGARVEVTSGFPRTRVVDAIFNAASQRFDPIFGSHNSSRLPAFAELSLRATYKRERDWGHYRVWLDLVNATNRDNVQERFYSADFKREGFVRGLPILPLIGAELRI